MFLLATSRGMQPPGSAAAANNERLISHHPLHSIELRGLAIGTVSQ
jgi:hypothetical protein